LISVTHLGPGSRVEFNEEHFKRLGQPYILQPSGAELLGHLRRIADRMNVTAANDPAAAREQHLYGSLLLTVSIRNDGSIEGIEVNRGSGSRILDAAAVKIVEMSAPFAPFPQEIKRDTDILHVTRTWMFTKADELVSQ
jgi:TonB family protein